jgi:flagellar protein FliO/FliZ
MRCALLAALLLSISGQASASDGGQGGFSFATSLVQMLGSLAVVLGLLYLATHLSKRWLKRGSGILGRQSYIRVVETRHLAPKKSLLLVEVGGEYLLLSNCGEGLSLVKQIDMLEEIEVIEVLGGKEHQLKGRFQEKLEGFMGGLHAPRLMAFDPRSEA